MRSCQLTRKSKELCSQKLLSLTLPLRRLQTTDSCAPLCKNVNISFLAFSNIAYMKIFYVFHAIRTAKGSSLSSPLKIYIARNSIDYTTTQCYDAENYNIHFYLSEKLLSYMEMRNLIDKILLSGADLISLSAGVQRKDGWGRGEGRHCARYLLPFSFHFKTLSCNYQNPSIAFKQCEKIVSKFQRSNS